MLLVFGKRRNRRDKIVSLPAGNTHPLLYITDTYSKLTFLVDSGAAVSVLPHSSQVKPSKELRAANGSTIACWGSVKNPINFKFQSFPPWNFLKAAVDTPILGADFLCHFSLKIDLANARLQPPFERITMASSTLKVVKILDKTFVTS